MAAGSQKGSTKSDALVKFVLFIFVSLLSFSVGTFVGKQVSDSDHRRVALEGEGKADRAVASVDEKGEAAEGGAKISDKEVESLTEEFVNKEKAAGGKEEAVAEKEEIAGRKVASEESSEKAEHEETKDAKGYKTFDRGAKHDAKKDAHHADAEHADKAEHSEHGEKSHESEHSEKAPAHKAVSHNDGTAKVAEKVAKNEAPTDGEKEERKPQSSALPSVASSAVGKYTIQVAAYLTETEAKTRAADLKAKGWNAFYFPATVKGHTAYRVSVGLYDSMKSAEEFRVQYMKEANTKEAFIQKIAR